MVKLHDIEQHIQFVKYIKNQIIIPKKNIKFVFNNII